MRQRLPRGRAKSLDLQLLLQTSDIDFVKGYHAGYVGTYFEAEISTQQRGSIDNREKGWW